MLDGFYFPGFLVPADPARWAARMETGCQAVEALFGIQLDHAFSGTKRNVTRKHVPDRRKFFEGRLKTRNRWFSLYSGTGLRRTATGYENVDYFNFGGNIYGGEELYKVSLTFPPQAPTTHEQLVVKLGDALQARSAQADPLGLGARVRAAHWCMAFGANAMRHALADRTAEENKIPLICESAYAGLGPLQPHHFGWLNYWSPDVCEHVGFPDHAQGLDVLEHSYRTPGGAWLVKLRADPPAVGDTGYLRLLRELYDRFPRVGIRHSGPTTEHSIGRKPQ